jgi:hypothetical protein
LQDGWGSARLAGPVSGALGIYLLMGGFIAACSRIRKECGDE